jgi:hypothetical protein
MQKVHFLIIIIIKSDQHILYLCYKSYLLLSYNTCFLPYFLDDEEDEEDEAYYTDAFDGMKQRMTTLNGKTDKMEKACILI